MKNLYFIIGGKYKEGSTVYINSDMKEMGGKIFEGEVIIARGFIGDNRRKLIRINNTWYFEKDWVIEIG